MSSGDLQIHIPENDQKLDEQMQAETPNEDTVTQFDQEDEDIIKKLKKKQEEEKKSSNGQDQNSITKIRRVPEVMTAEKGKLSLRKYFTPNAIAIGPIHHARKNVFVNDDKKEMWAAKYLDGLEERKILEDIKRQIVKLKAKFDEKCLDMDENTLARMLFVDGCAMLQFIYSFVWNDDFVKHLKINAAQATLVQQDLFLLENQIPFKVLQIIMEGGQNNQQKERAENEKQTKLAEMKTAVRIFICLSNMTTGKALSPPKLQFDDKAVHLLDLLRQSLLHDPCSAPSDDSSHWAFELPFYVLKFLVRLAAFIVVAFFCLIYILIDFLINGVRFRTLKATKAVLLYIAGFPEKPDSPTTKRSFRNVQELKAAGIGLKPSKSRCLNKVRFSPGLFGGCLRLCPILVDKSTEGKLLNLIAYEMCPDFHCKTSKDGKSYDYKISNYLSFLDSLIDNEQDVKDLRAANILRHRLSSDKEVADLFNNISCISVADDAYGEVNSAIQEYYERIIPIWIAEFRQEHLSSPWTILALIAATVVLGLTATQTYFTINPR